MDVRRFLYNCRGAVIEIRSLERQRDAVRLPMGPRANPTSIVELIGKDNDPTATALNNLDYYDALLKEKQNALAQELLRLENILGHLKDNTGRAIMRYYFGQGWRNYRIAEELEIDESTVKRKRWTAVQFLERKFKFVTKCP